MTTDNTNKKKTRTIYVNEDEYEYLKMKLKIFRAQQTIKEEEDKLEERARKLMGDSHV